MSLSGKWHDELVRPGLLAAGLLALLYLVTPLDMGMVRLGDGTTYTIMAEQPGAQVGHLHRYRVLGPFIVHWLPFDVDLGFRLLTYASTFLTCLLIFHVGRSLGLSSTRALLLILMYVLTWPTLANVWQYRLIDPVAWFFVAGGLLLTLRGRFLEAILLAGVGSLAKEVVLLVIPLAASMYAWVNGVRRVAVVATTVLLGLGPYVLLRMAVSGPEQEINSSLVLEYLLSWPKLQLKEVGVSYTLFYLFVPFAALWLLAPLGARHIERKARGVLVAWLFVTAPLIMVGSPERMLEIQAPAVLPLAAFGLVHAHPVLAVAIVTANGLFIARVASQTTPYWLAWGSLGFSVGCVIYLWYKAIMVARHVDPRLAVKHSSAY